MNAGVEGGMEMGRAPQFALAIYCTGHLLYALKDFSAWKVLTEFL